MMMMSFFCSCRNNNQPNAIYLQPIGYFPPEINESTCDDATIMSLWYYDVPFSPLVDVVVR